MNQATIGRRTYQVAGSFNELTGRQLTAVAGLLHSGRPKLELKLRLLLVLLQLRFRLVLQWLLMYRVSDEQRYLLTQLTAFLFREPKLTKQPFPTIRRYWYSHPLKGPADGFTDMTFAEWIDADAHFAAYRREQDEQHLNRLVATLWRPAGEEYDPARVEARARQLARVPLAMKLAVRMWFASCQAYWVKRYTGTVFKAAEPGAAPSTQNPRQIWHEVLAERAGSPDRYELMGKQLLVNMLFDLDLRIRRQQEEQERLLKNRR